MRWILACLVGVAAMAGGTGARGAAAAEDHADAARGYELLTTKPYLPPDFDQETFEAVWRVWPEPLRSQARDATVEERRGMAFRRYGLTGRPDDPSRPLQYVVGSGGAWSMNCFACHGGRVNGAVSPGSPNTDYALATLTEEIRAVKLLLGKPLGHMDVGSLFIPLGSNVGTTNSVNFGIALMARRDADLNVIEEVSLPPLMHHDLDAPPWWHLRRKTRMYVDGFAGKGHRGLMQFLLVKQNGPRRFREWEEDFRHILAYIESIEPPAYPFEIDRELARTGRGVFENACSRCHGTYGPGESRWPEELVAIEEVGTDRVRLDALAPDRRAHYGSSWFAGYGAQRTEVDPGGYVAPPLDGIWASAPYLHNGSVPTLWHLLHPDERPRVWKRTGEEYDPVRVGLSVETFEALPAALETDHQRRQHFDTTQFGKSNAGHLFPEELTPAQRRAVLEYLKTL